MSKRVKSIKRESPKKKFPNLPPLDQSMKILLKVEKLNIKFKYQHKGESSKTLKKGKGKQIHQKTPLQPKLNEVKSLSIGGIPRPKTLGQTSQSLRWIPEVKLLDNP
eukprot:TRINITY_DN6083_c0_g1_i2.p2 TRINITY_DN6083_c0_g1~~TRINITY_DN6083_c0_g1_i2.p2  ORF type:complete len:107 (-),score=11.70 TRINITY_DN6083_c0_g1_i2:2107-2427(-)